MDAMQDQMSIEALAKHMFHVEFLLASILFLLLLGSATLLFMACRFIGETRKLAKVYAPDTLYTQLGDLLDEGKTDEIIRLAGERLSTHPKDLQAHWYLARAYHAKEEWSKALAEYRSVSQIEPRWRDEWVEPYVKEIEETLGRLETKNGQRSI